MQKFLKDLRTIAWRTAGARYNAARRLKQREWFSTFSLAVLSALSIAVAFAQKIYSPTSGTPLDNYLSSLAAAFGVFLLVISLLEWGAGYGARAEALHRNAENLTAFHWKVAQILAQIDAGTSITDDTVNDIRIEYEAIKDKCPHNHLPIDDAMFRARHRLAKEFTDDGGRPLISRYRAWLASIRWHISELWFFGIIWAVVLLALAYSVRIPKA